MDLPDKEKIENLLLKVHVKNNPNWTTSNLIEVHEQLSNLYMHWFRKELPTTREKLMKTEIKLNKHELQCGTNRQHWAEELILQLPNNHDGRNSWLLNHGIKKEAVDKRLKMGLEWDDDTESTETVSTHMDTTHKRIEVDDEFIEIKTGFKVKITGVNEVSRYYHFEFTDTTASAGIFSKPFAEFIQKYAPIKINDDPVFVDSTSLEIPYESIRPGKIQLKPDYNRDAVMSHNVGDSNYAQKRIQPWDVWEEYKLNPWDADIVKRVLRNKSTQSRKLDYEKIIHVCQKRISQIDNGIETYCESPEPNMCENCLTMFHHHLNECPNCGEVKC